MRRIGLLGGSFDPIHLGHLVVAEHACRELGLDEVVFIPAGRPWQKTTVAPAEDRFEMTRLAVQGRAGLGVSRVEVDRAGPTYTVDTLRELHAQHPDAELWMLLGSDALASLDTWREPEEVARLARFAVAARPGTDLPREPGVRGVAVMELDFAELDVSSSQVRARLAAGQPVDGLIPAEVEDYIRGRGLYGARPDDGEAR